MKKSYVQLGDNFFKVVIGDRGPFLTAVSAEEAMTQQMEDIMISDEQEISTSMFQSVIDNARASLAKTLETNLKETVMRSMGFEKDSWGNGWKVDHCNGRMSVVSDLISKEVKERLLNVEFGKDFTLTDQEKKQMQDDMRKDFMESYRRKMREIIWSDAQKLAEKHASDYIKELTQNRLKEVSDAMLEKIIKK